MRDFVLLYVNGRRYEVRGRNAFSSLSDFLRNDLGLIGTKIVCAEGDCGSCSTLLGKAGESQLSYRSVCSCIQFLYQLDCTHIITVEGLKYDGMLNPVQEALVQFQGTQCGFCTPGFVVSLCGAMEGQLIRDADDVRAACVGNLCRCTGYESIIRAGESVNLQKMRPLNELHPAEPMVKEFAKHQQDTIEIRDGELHLFKPAEVRQACEFKSRHPDCTVIAGGTDIGVGINKHTRTVKTVLGLSGLRTLSYINVSDSQIHVGALTTLSEIENICREHLPEYAKLLYWFGSPPIKNAGTIGGNIANGSPIGDTMPALFVLNAEIEITGVSGVRRVNMNDFYTGYRKTVLKTDELITSVVIPIPAGDEIFKLYKVSRRKDLDISAFTAAIWIKRDGESVSDVRIAYGGVGPMILRLTKTEAFIKGRMLDAETLEQAGVIARSEATPITDVRGSADYRLQLAENILMKLHADLNESQPVMY